MHPTMYTLKVKAVALNVYDLKLNRGMGTSCWWALGRRIRSTAR